MLVYHKGDDLQEFLKNARLLVTAGLLVEVVLEPGDATRYCFVFHRSRGHTDRIYCGILGSENTLILVSRELVTLDYVLEKINRPEITLWTVKLFVELINRINDVPLDCHTYDFETAQPV